MLKNALLALSLLINGVVAYIYYFPPTGQGERMSCFESRSEPDSKTATETFVERNGGSMAKTHEFLKNSDFNLRNMTDTGDAMTFIYVATSYRLTCGLHLPGVDGTIVRVRTDISAKPRVKAVF